MRKYVVHLDGASAFKYRFENSDVKTAVLTTTSLLERIAAVGITRDLCVVKINNRYGMFWRDKLLVEAFSKLKRFETVVLKLWRYPRRENNFFTFEGVRRGIYSLDDFEPFKTRFAELNQSLATELGPSVIKLDQQGWDCLTFHPKAFINSNPPLSMEDLSDDVVLMES